MHLKELLNSRRGEEMVEASISLPVIILVVMLMLRLFTFYLEILNTGIKEHEKAVENWRSFDKPYIDTFRRTKKVSMLKGGILLGDVGKNMELKAYLFNEDMLVRMGEINAEE